MFVWLGRWVYRARYVVVIGFGALMAGVGIYGLDLPDRYTQQGWFDDGSESGVGTILADNTFGRNFDGDVIAYYTAPAGKHVNDPDITAAAKSTLNTLATTYQKQVKDVSGYWNTGLVSGRFADKDKTHAFVAIGLQGDGDKDTLQYFHDTKDKLAITGLDLQIGGRVPVADAVGVTLEHDVRRAELIALPLVALMLFFVFGGAVAAFLPVLIGGLSIIGSQGIVRGITTVTDVNSFAGSVITLIGLGLAIDYGLFSVSRFREEIAEGKSPADAVRVTVATAGRTIVFSAAIIVICLGGLLIFPQVALKSVAYGAISAVALAAVLSITVLPAILGVLGARIDSLSLRTIGITRFSRTKTAAQIDGSFWSRLALWAMKRPTMLAVPIMALLLLLVLPFFKVEFGGISEKYLAPDNSTRLAQEAFDTSFPTERTNPIMLVIKGGDQQIWDAIKVEADKAPGLTGAFERPGLNGLPKDDVFRWQAGLKNTDDADATIDVLRSIRPPPGVTMYVTGMPALESDSIQSMIDKLPILLAILLIASFVMMFLTFGSFVLPIKAAVVSALSLTATLGFLTLVFYDGIGADALNFTPQPLQFAVLIMIVAVVFGLSTDYEIFLMSRMIEAREQGKPTPECIRYGIAHTGGIITAAALILIVVTGAFGLSDLVMMKYISYGMIAALILDATIIRMLLVPAVMKLLGDRCWWAPAWAKRLHERIGLKDYA